MNLEEEEKLVRKGENDHLLICSLMHSQIFIGVLFKQVKGEIDSFMLWSLR